MNEWDIAIKAVREHGKCIAVGIASGLCLALCLVLFQQPVWQAEMVIGPTQRTGVPSLSTLLPQTAADAPALQYFAKRIDAATSSDFTHFETVFDSAATISSLIKKEGNILPYNSTDKMQIWLDGHLKIRPLGLTPYLKITLRHHDAGKAVAILSNLYTITDQAIRQDKKIKTNRRIAYLKDQLDTVHQPDYRDALVSLLKEQEQTAMMASIDQAFAAEVIKAPSVLPKPVSPRAIILFPLLALSGGMIGLMFSGFRKALTQ